MKKDYLKYVLILLSGVLVGGVVMSFSMRKKYGDMLDSSYRNWMKLNYILAKVDENYVDTVDKKKTTDAALTAVMQSLDPHSVYLLPEPLKKSDDDLAGDFEGVGLQFNVPNDTAVVLAVIAGGPSEKAGIQTGDRILKVNDIAIAGVKMPQDSMVRLMRGPKGTKVTLTMGREGEEIPFNIIRDKIAEHSVSANFMIDDSTAYLCLTKFSRTTYSECVDAIVDLSSKGMRRLILDLRGNVGGYLDQCCLLANEFLPKGAMIVYTEGKNRSREEMVADGSARFSRLPVAVLVDDASASASEILAGAIQDNDRGIVVGRRSFGKGLVQEPMYFSDGTGIRLTVARFHTPSGRCIQKPYGDKDDEYGYDFYKRYASGELMSADSIKVDSSKVYTTVGGRTVFGGGGIIPDVYVPLDTTRTTVFYQECSKKAVILRFAAKFMDGNRETLNAAGSYDRVRALIDNCGIEEQFLAFASSLGIRCTPEEWKKSSPYMLPQIKGLCARYSKFGEEAYFRYFLPMDDVVNCALSRNFAVSQ